MKSLLFIAIFISPLICGAQSENNNKAETIIITRKGIGNEKLNIVIDGRTITVNGRNANSDSTITIQRMNTSYNKPRLDFRKPGVVDSSIKLDDFLKNFSLNKAFLGVATKETNDGLVINNIVEKSAAEKAGLKEGDIIVAIDGKKLQTSDELSELVKSKKPGETITINYKRDKKNQSTEAKLSNSSTNNSLAFNGFNFPIKGAIGNKELEFFERNLNLNKERNAFRPLYSETPKLGIQISSDENSNQVKITKVTPNSAADKAGLKENDVLSKVDNVNIASVNSAFSEIEKAKIKQQFTITISRNGKPQTINIKLIKKPQIAEL